MCCLFSPVQDLGIVILFRRLKPSNFSSENSSGPYPEANIGWAVLSDEQTSNGWPFSLLNGEQMSNKVGVQHQPVDILK